MTKKKKRKPRLVPAIWLRYPIQSIRGCLIEEDIYLQEEGAAPVIHITGSYTKGHKDGYELGFSHAMAIAQGEDDDEEEEEEGGGIQK